MKNATFIVGDVFNVYDTSINSLRNVRTPWMFFIYINRFLMFTPKDFGYKEFAFTTEKEANDFRDIFIKEFNLETLNDYVIKIQSSGEYDGKRVQGLYQNVDRLLDDIRSTSNKNLNQTVLFWVSLGTELFYTTNNFLSGHMIGLVKLK